MAELPLSPLMVAIVFVVVRLPAQVLLALGLVTQGALGGPLALHRLLGLCVPRSSGDTIKRIAMSCACVAVSVSHEVHK